MKLFEDTIRQHTYACVKTLLSTRCLRQLRTRGTRAVWGYHPVKSHSGYNRMYNDRSDFTCPEAGAFLQCRDRQTAPRESARQPLGQVEEPS